MKKKKLIVTVTGKKYKLFSVESLNEVYEFDTTGSRLDINRKISEAVSIFLKKYDIGSCSASHYIKP